MLEDREHAIAGEHGLGVGDCSGAVLGLGRGAILAGAGRCRSLLPRDTPSSEHGFPLELALLRHVGGGGGGQRTPF